MKALSAYPDKEPLRQSEHMLTGLGGIFKGSVSVFLGWQQLHDYRQVNTTNLFKCAESLKIAIEWLKRKCFKEVGEHPTFHFTVYVSVCGSLHSTLKDSQTETGEGLELTKYKGSDEYLQTASSGKAQLLLKERDKDRWLSRWTIIQETRENKTIRQHCCFVNVKLFSLFRQKALISCLSACEVQLLEAATRGWRSAMAVRVQLTKTHRFHQLFTIY